MASATYMYPSSYHRSSSHLVAPNPLFDAVEVIRHYRNEDPIERFDAMGAPVRASCARFVVGNDEMQTLMDSHWYSALPHHRVHPQRFYGTDTMFYIDKPVVSDEFFGSAAELQQHRENPRYCGRSPASFSDESFAFVTAHQQHRVKPHQFAYTQHKMVTISIPPITAFQQPPPSSTSFSKFQFWAQLCQIKEGKGGKIRRDHFWRNNKKKPSDRPPCTTDNGNGEGISDICFLDLDLEISESLFTSHTMEENKLFAASFINGERVVSVSDKTDLTSYVSRVDDGITEDDDLVGGTIGSQEADECALTALKLFDDILVRNVSVEQSDVHKQLGGWPLLQSEVIKQELSSLAHAGEGDESGDYGDMFRRTGIGVVCDANGVGCDMLGRRGIGVVCGANGVGCDMFRRTGICVVCDAIRLNGDKFSKTGIGVVCDVNRVKFDMLRRTGIGVKVLALVSEIGGLDCVEELDAPTAQNRNVVSTATIPVCSAQGTLPGGKSDALKSYEHFYEAVNNTQDVLVVRDEFLDASIAQTANVVSVATITDGAEQEKLSGA